MKEQPELGVAIAVLTGERRLLTVQEYFALDEVSEARWEFLSIRTNPVTGAPHPYDLQRFGFEPGSPTVIEGYSREIVPGIFELVDPGDEDAELSGGAAGRECEPELQVNEMSSPVRSKALASPEEYLAMDRAAEQKSEYYDGEIVALAGASFRHNVLASNLIFALRTSLRGSSCQVLPSDMRVWNPARQSYTFPDVVVVCGAPRLADDHHDVLLNPTLLIEILSDSTESKDRGAKAEGFRRLASLHEYLLVSQREVRVERYRRYVDRQWMLTEALDLDDVLELDSVGCTLALRDVYENAFDTPADAGTQTETEHG